jgi:hypothetical protein
MSGGRPKMENNPNKYQLRDCLREVIPSGDGVPIVVSGVRVNRKTKWGS